ncbi:MAG TPA: hypothetical protein VGM77_00645 [Gemmatimonadales bacterium]|jgi:hypothetical protein
MRSSRFLSGLALSGGLLLAACGGDAKASTTSTIVPADSAAHDSSKAGGKPGAKVVVKAKGQLFDTAAAGGLRPLVRETYQYEASALRDPFQPLVQAVERGPELPDLRLVAILYDDHRADGSIVTFRDIGDDHRYTLSPGQHLGRISVVEVTATTVKLREDDLGTARDQTYSLRKPGDEKP